MIAMTELNYSPYPSVDPASLPFPARGNDVVPMSPDRHPGSFSRQRLASHQATSRVGYCHAVSYRVNTSVRPSRRIR